MRKKKSRLTEKNELKEETGTERSAASKGDDKKESAKIIKDSSSLKVILSSSNFHSQTNVTAITAHGNTNPCLRLPTCLKVAINLR